MAIQVEIGDDFGLDNEGRYIQLYLSQQLVTKT